MKTSTPRHFICLTVTLIILTRSSISQVPDFSKVPNVEEGDSLNNGRLINNGVNITTGKTICWFPKDSLSEKQMKEIVDTINTGIMATEKFIGAPLPWQVHRINEPYTFYFRADSFISHASLAGFVSVSFWRIKRGKAPWLHEALHEMLYSKNDKWFSPEVTEKFSMENMPLWLQEGLPDYISAKVSRQSNLSCFDVFSNRDRPNADSVFIQDIKSKNGSYIIAHIGANGIMPELFSKDRMQYGPAFYHGSCSFVQFIAENYGMKTLLTAISSFEREQESIEGATGKPIAILKKEWLDKLKIKE